MAKKEGSCFRNARDASVLERRGILGGIGARRTRMRRWAGLAAAPPLDSRLTFAILPPILRLAPLRPETRQAACCTLLAREPALGPSIDRRVHDRLPLLSDFSFASNEKNRSIFRDSRKGEETVERDLDPRKRDWEEGRRNGIVWKRLFVCSVGVE